VSLERPATSSGRLGARQTVPGHSFGAQLALECALRYRPACRPGAARYRQRQPLAAGRGLGGDVQGSPTVGTGFLISQAVQQAGNALGVALGAIQGRSAPGWIVGPPTLPVLAEEAHHVLRDLPEAGVYRLRAGLLEHVPHVRDQDKLRLIIRGLEVFMEFNRLRLKDFSVVDTLNNKNRRRVRGNEMRGAGKNQIPAVTFPEGLLNAGRRESRCSLGKVCWAEHVCHGAQGARFRWIRSGVPRRVQAGEGSERGKLSSHTGAEREYLAGVQAVPWCLGPIPLS
jgi:hypothetical protein